MEELAEPVPVFSAGIFAVTALKVEGFPQAIYLFPQTPPKPGHGWLVRTCPTPGQARARGHPEASGQAGGRAAGAQLLAALCSSPASGSEGSGLDTGVLSASCTLACRPDLGPAFCSPDSGTLPEPSCRGPSEVTQLSSPDCPIERLTG